MHRKITVLFTFLLMISFLGCSIQKTDKFRKKSTSVTELDSIQAANNELRDCIADLEKNNRRIKDLLALAERAVAGLDSAVSENQTLKAENRRLQAQLAQARDVIPQMREQYENIFSAQQAALDQKEELLSCVVSDLWEAYGINNALSDTNAALQTENDQLRPWASKWQNDSKRSFIKVMFGAGKAPVPDVPKPPLE